MSSTGLHESEDRIRSETADYHRAVVSLMEELEAVDWYNQRIDAAADEELKSILAHNRDEEKEHAAMVLEWLRRRDPVVARELSDKLFTSGEIAHEGPANDTAAAADSQSEHGSLGIGSLKGASQ